MNVGFSQNLHVILCFNIGFGPQPKLHNWFYHNITFQKHTQLSSLPTPKKYIYNIVAQKMHWKSYKSFYFFGKHFPRIDGFACIQNLFLAFILSKFI